MTLKSETLAFGGKQCVFAHKSRLCKTQMNIGVYMPPCYDKSQDLPAVIFLSGLTCTEQNFITKAGAQRMAAKLGMVIIAPDTSPRGDGVPDAPERYDLGQGAGFYVDATQEPWAKNFQMESYICDELLEWIGRNLPPVNMKRIGIMGHSMGGHGALTLHLKHPDLFKTCTAFSPICAPSQVQWGIDAFTAYLGTDKQVWADHDACMLVQKSPSLAHILIDQGMADEFMDKQLKPELFRHACQEAGQYLSLRYQDGYDHSYYFISTFIEDHLRHHDAGL